jgi:hypothetical protein
MDTLKEIEEKLKAGAPTVGPQIPAGGFPSEPQLPEEPYGPQLPEGWTPSLKEQATPPRKGVSVEDLIASADAQRSLRSGPQMRPGADTRTMDQLRGAEQPSLLKTAIDMYHAVKSGKDQTYEAPSGQPDPEFLAMRAKNEKMANFQSPEYDMMGRRTAPSGIPGMEPPPPPPDQFKSPEYDMMGRRTSPSGIEGMGQKPLDIASLGEPKGVQGPPQTDQWDRIAELAPDDSGARNRMILSIMEGLTRAGAEASNVPLITELLAGKGRGPTDQTNADMLRQFIDKGAQSDEQKKAWATSSARKAAEDMYGRKFDSPDDLKTFQQTQKGEADIKAQEGLTESRKFASQLKKDEAEYTQKVAEQRKQLLASGDLSGLDKDSQKKLDELRTNLNKEEAKLIDSVRIADKGLKSVDELSDNDMAYMAAGVMVARASGEVGNLSKTEVQVYNKHPHAEGQLEAFADWARGEISQGRRDTVMEILKHHRDEGIKRLRQRVTDETDAFRTFNKDANPDAVMKFMGLGMPEEVQGKAKAEMVEMYNPKEDRIVPVKPEHVEGLKLKGWSVQ